MPTADVDHLLHQAPMSNKTHLPGDNTGLTNSHAVTIGTTELRSDVQSGL